MSADPQARPAAADPVGNPEHHTAPPEEAPVGAGEVAEAEFELPGNPKVQAAITIAIFIGFVAFVAICLPLYFF